MKKLLTVFLAFCFAFAGCARRGTEEPVSSCEPSALPEAVDETPDIESAFCRACVYFKSDDGFLVPVTKRIPWEEGIASAVLKLMVSDPVNVSEAKEMGLSTVIPAGTSVSISIADGNALVDLKALSALSSPEDEIAMVKAIVNTLCGFPTINSVTITRDGRGDALENGTELPVRQPAYELNPEDGELSASTGAVPVTLYYPNRSGSLFIPVTRYVGGANLYTVAAALIEGPKSSAVLRSFPKDTLLLGATLENGVLTLNLSQDFAETAETEGLFSLCYKAAWLTLSQGNDFSKLRFQVNGCGFEPEAVAPPAEINEVP